MQINTLLNWIIIDFLYGFLISKIPKQYQFDSKLIIIIINLNSNKMLYIINFNKTKMAKRKQHPKIAGFINKLLQIFKNQQNQQFVSYNQESRSFKIENVRKFTDSILPKYFKHKNYSSFVRQANLYGFHKLSSEGKEQIYQHEFFTIDSIKDLKKIKRKLMGSQIKRIKQKQHSQYDESDSQYNCPDESEAFCQGKQFNKHRSAEDQKKESMESKIEELEKKKLLIQRKIKQEEENNVRLQYENKHLKDTFQDENLSFYGDTLNILMGIIVSQYEIEEISSEDYYILIEYLQREQQQLFGVQQQRKDLEEKQQGMNKKEMGIGNLSELLCSLRFIIGEENDPNTIRQFIGNLIGYVKRQSNVKEQIQMQFNNLFMTSKSEKYALEQISNHILMIENLRRNSLQQMKAEMSFQRIKEQYLEQRFSNPQIRQDKPQIKKDKQLIWQKKEQSRQNKDQERQNRTQIKEDRLCRKIKKLPKRHQPKQQDDQYLPNNR